MLLHELLNNAWSLISIISNTASGVNETGDPGILICPNPSEGRFLLELHNVFSNEISIDLVNALGQKVYTDHVASVIGTTVKKEIDVSDISNGVYSIEIMAGSNTVHRKIVIMR